MLCKELAGCGKLKFCFLRFFFPSDILNLWLVESADAEPMDMEGGLCVCVCVHIYYTQIHIYTNTQHPPSPPPCFFKQLLFRKFAAPSSDPDSTFWGHIAEPRVDNPHAMPSPLVVWMGKHTHTWCSLWLWHWLVC